MLNTTIYKHPQFRAAVAIERRGEMILLDFLARGRSQKKSGGRVVGYTTRNPDRRALVDHVIACLGRAPIKGAIAVGSAGGKGSTYQPLGVGALDPTVRKSYSSSGNYRWRLWLQLPAGAEAGRPEVELQALVRGLGLKNDQKHRPVSTTWPAVLLAAIIAVVEESCQEIPSGCSTTAPIMVWRRHRAEGDISFSELQSHRRVLQEFRIGERGVVRRLQCVL